MTTKSTNKADFVTVQKIRTVTPGDILLVVGLIAGAIFSIPAIHARQPSTVAIYIDNALYAEYPLCEDREIPVRGRKGLMKIGVQECRVSVLCSTCREQICVKSGHISASFQQLVCAPNHVLVEIRSGNGAGKEIDAIAQ